jgi:hypothetical protein
MASSDLFWRDINVAYVAKMASASRRKRSWHQLALLYGENLKTK